MARWAPSPFAARAPIFLKPAGFPRYVPARRTKKVYSSPSRPWLEVGAPPSMDGTPAGGAALGAALGAAAGFAVVRGAAFFTGFLAAARFAGFFAALRFAGFFAVFDAFLVVLVFLPPFLALG